MSALPKSVLTTDRKKGSGNAHVIHITQHLFRAQVFLAILPVFKEFKQQMLRASRENGVRIIEYSVQPNHYHIMVWAERISDVFRMMHSLNTGFCMRLRHLPDEYLKEQRVFSGRPAYREIHGFEQMMICARYIYRNRPDNTTSYWASSDWDFTDNNPGFRENDNLLLMLTGMNWADTHSLFEMSDEAFSGEILRLEKNFKPEALEAFFKIDPAIPWKEEQPLDETVINTLKEGRQHRKG